MYNYRIGNITDQEILYDVRCFCNDVHNEDELLKHVRKTLSNLFALHECSLFSKPKNLDDSVWKDILHKYCNCITRSNITFPDRNVDGPAYESRISHANESSSGNSDGYQENKDKRLTKLLPYFFGITYTCKKQNKVFGWSPSINPKNIMEEHRKLYDILFSFCYPNGNLEYDEKEKNNILGNFAKPSIFRFDDGVTGNYRKVIDYIRKELIYRITGSNPWEKLRDAMYVEQNASQIRSLVFSLIEQLMKPEFNEFLPIPKTSDTRKYYWELYEHIIKRCMESKVISIKEKGKKEKHVSPINMDIKDNENAVLYYAYAFFVNNQTFDYIHEMQKLLQKNCSDLDAILNLSEQYKMHRGLVIMVEFTRGDSEVQYKCIEKFINKAWDCIIPSIYIDDYEKGKGEAFCKRHKENMITFLRLFQLINHRTDEEYIFVGHLLDLLHLYSRLKACKVSIPTSSSGYNKTNPTKPVKVDNAMKSLREEWDLREKNKTVKDELYMKNVIIETWLSAVMYMTINDFDCSLFIKRMDATRGLLVALLQRIPLIVKKNEKDVDYGAIIHDLIGIRYAVNEHIR